MKLVKEKGCYYETTDNGSTPLHAAAKSGSLEIVEYFIMKKEELKIDINAKKTSTGHTPLHFACYKGHLEIVRMLLEHDSNSNDLTAANASPLYFAAKGGNMDCLELLLDFKANIN